MTPKDLRQSAHTFPHGSVERAVLLERAATVAYLLGGSCALYEAGRDFSGDAFRFAALDLAKAAHIK